MSLLPLSLFFFFFCFLFSLLAPPYRSSSLGCAGGERNLAPVFLFFCCVVLGAFFPGWILDCYGVELAMGVGGDPWVKYIPFSFLTCLSSLGLWNWACLCCWVLCRVREKERERFPLAVITVVYCVGGAV
jgi:hypothetical protein